MKESYKIYCLSASLMMACTSCSEWYNFNENETIAEEKPIEQQATPQQEEQTSWEVLKAWMTSFSYDADIDAVAWEAWQNKDDKDLYALLTAQHRENPSSFPIFSGRVLPLRITSAYDSYEGVMTLRAPEHDAETAPLVVVMGDDDATAWEGSEAWVAHIPSRARMNYQLVAEGDFSRMVAEIKTIYPFLGKTPTYLVGTGKASDAALLMVKAKREYFDGVAFSGDGGDIECINLEYLPVVYFSEGEAASPSTRFISTLQARGNAYASSMQGTASQAAERLITTQKKDRTKIFPFTFEDYNSSKITPWLHVIGKRSEKDLVTLEAYREGDDLAITAYNVTAIDIAAENLPEGLQGIKTVTLNDLRFPFSGVVEGTVRVAEKEYASATKGKGENPGELINFYRNDPLYIVYQDAGEGKEYLEAAHDLARTFSSLRFMGFPPLEVDIPVVALSDYDVGTLPRHRAIIMGTAQGVEGVVASEGEDLLAMTSGEAADLVGDMARAYGLVCSTDDSSSLALALLFVAEDVEGLQALRQRYATATALYDDADLIVWKKGKEGYDVVWEETFDSFWGKGMPASLLVELPQQRAEVWKRYTRELLIKEGATLSMMLTPYFEEDFSLPSRVTHEALRRAFHDKTYVVLHASYDDAQIIVQRALGEVEEIEVYDLDEVIAGGKRLDGGAAHILVDMEVLKLFSEEEQALLDYDVLAYSLPEMVARDIVEDRESFGKEFLRMAQAMEYED
jgi:hypothetical protein